MNYPVAWPRQLSATVALAVVVSTSSLVFAANDPVAVTAAPVPTIGRPADQIIGQDVRSTTGQDLGEVEDLVVDANGRIHYALVSSGGVLGVGAVMRAVPFELFTSTATGPGKALAVDLQGKDWDRAPLYRADQFATLAPDQQGREIYRYYGREWTSDSKRRDADGAARMLLVSQIDDQRVLHGGQEIGKIDEVLIHQGRAYGVLKPATTSPLRNQQFIISLAQLSWDFPDSPVANSRLSLDDLAQAQPLPADVSRASWDKAYVLTGTPSGRAAPAPIVESSADPVPVTQRASLTAVQHALRQDAALAPALQNVRIDSRDGKIVLSGAVASRELRRQIVDKAERVARGWEIDNQLEVRSTAE